MPKACLPRNTACLPHLNIQLHAAGYGSGRRGDGQRTDLRKGEFKLHLRSNIQNRIIPYFYTS